jgi:hypothetical protein
MYYGKERVHCSLLKVFKSITWPAFLGSSLHGPCLGYSPHPSFSGSCNTRTSSIVHPTGRFPTNWWKGPSVKTRYADPLWLTIQSGHSAMPLLASSLFDAETITCLKLHFELRISILFTPHTIIQIGSLYTDRRHVLSNVYLTKRRRLSTRITCRRTPSLPDGLRPLPVGVVLLVVSFCECNTKLCVIGFDCGVCIVLRKWMLCY